MEFPTLTNWTSPYLFKGLVVGFFHIYANFNRIFCSQTVETLIAESDLGLLCLPVFHRKEARLIWVKLVTLLLAVTP